jgi:hypothetical protein
MAGLPPIETSTGAAARGTGDPDTDDKGTTRAEKGVADASMAAKPVATVRGRTLVPGVEADFTFRDLNATTLRLAPDSRWLPTKLRDNLFKLVGFALNPVNAIDGVPLSQGINLYDLFHGHLIVKKPGQIADSRFVEARQRHDAFGSAYSDAIVAAIPELASTWHIHGSVHSDAQQRRRIRAADHSVAPMLEELVLWLLATFPDADMLYHSYEWRKPPGITVKSSNRHLLVPLDPRRGEPAARGDLDDYEQIYIGLQQLCFLVSPTGHLYLRGGKDLSLTGLEL